MNRCMRALMMTIAIVTLGVAAARADWPEFRGPHGDGHADGAAGLPVKWSESENVKWKTPIPERGWSTPVVLGGQVWLTTATPDGHDFFALCVDAQSGKILFNEKLFHADTPEPLGNPINCYASPSPAIEPGRVYLSFGSYGTVCLDTATFKDVWRRTDIPCRHYRGPGSSLAIFEDLLILTMDGVDAQYLTALNKLTGKTVWRTDRTTKWTDVDSQGHVLNEGDMRKAFSTPYFAALGGKTQMVSPGAKAGYSYDPRSGKELWHVTYKGFSNVARAIAGHGFVYIVTGFASPELWAVRPDGTGDVTASHVAWKARKGIARTPSPILVDDLLYAVGEDGSLTCLEAKTGTQVWQEKIGGGGCLASPIYADGRLYFFSQKGQTTVIKPGRKCEILAQNNLGDGFMASPAVDGKALILRSKTALYRVEQ